MGIPAVTDAQRNVMTLLKSGGAFENPISSSIATTTNSTTAALAQIDTVGNGLLDHVRPQLESAITQMGSLQSHSDDLVSNFPKKLDTMRHHTTVHNLFETTQQRSLCDVLDNAFGSIMGVGKALLASVGAAIAGIMGIIAGLIDAASGIILALTQEAEAAINALLSTLGNALSSIGEMIAQELKAFTDALKNLIDYNAILGMLDWLTDPCSAQVFDNVATPQMKTAASDMIVN